MEKDSEEVVRMLVKIQKESGSSSRGPRSILTSRAADLLDIIDELRARIDRGTAMLRNATTWNDDPQVIIDEVEAAEKFLSTTQTKESEHG